MGDPRRFNEFSAEISKEFNKNISIADVAGGKGFLRLALAEKGFKNVETWDKRTNRLKISVGTQRFSYFEWDKAPIYDGVVGLHSDQGTDQIVQYCGLHRIKGLICPCCAKQGAVTYWGANKYKEWTKHLEKLANSWNLNVSWRKMKFNGRNDLMILNP